MMDVFQPSTSGTPVRAAINSDVRLERGFVAPVGVTFSQGYARAYVREHANQATSASSIRCQNLDGHSPQGRCEEEYSHTRCVEYEEHVALPVMKPHQASCTVSSVADNAETVFDVVAATSSDAQVFLNTVAGTQSRFALDLGMPDHPATLEGYGMDPDLLEVSVLAALQRSGRGVIDMAQLPAYTADALVPKELVSKIRDLQSKGLIRQWGLHARTVKQVIRAMSLIGMDFVAFSTTELGCEALPGILNAAARARVRLIVSVPADIPATQIEDLRRHDHVEAVLLQVHSEANLATARHHIQQLSKLKNLSADPSTNCVLEHIA